MSDDQLKLLTQSLDLLTNYLKREIAASRVRGDETIPFDLESIVGPLGANAIREML